MTTSMQKQTITPSWSVEQIQTAACTFAGLIISNKMALIGKLKEEAEPLAEDSARRKFELLKSKGVRTPLDLVKHMAEFEVNVFGAKASISGDETKATLYNERPTAWLEAKRMAEMTEEQELCAQDHHKQWLKMLADNFSFNVQVEMPPDGNSETITFSKK